MTPSPRMRKESVSDSDRNETIRAGLVELFDAHKVTRIGNRLGGGENARFRRELAEAVLTTLGLHDIEAFAEKVAEGVKGRASA